MGAWNAPERCRSLVPVRAAASDGGLSGLDVLWKGAQIERPSAAQTARYLAVQAAGDGHALNRLPGLAP